MTVVGMLMDCIDGRTVAGVLCIIRVTCILLLCVVRLGGGVLVMRCSLCGDG